MNLTRVTITGADESVAPRTLLELSDQFPFVEWGILHSSDRNGRCPRYPSPNWRAYLAQHQSQDARRFALSLHVCGEAARHVLAGIGDVLQLSPMPFRRIQLNGYDGRLQPRHICANPGWEWILQCQDAPLSSAADHLERFRAANPRAQVSALLDVSGGRGKVLNYFPEPPKGLPVGYAGGIGPDNVVEIIERVCAIPGEAETWIDMESGVRTDDAFDIDKVWRVLERAAPYVKGAS